MDWTISQLDCKPVEGDLTNVVITAHWRCTGEQDGFTASVYGTCGFGAPGEPFVAYDDLTLNQVLGWVWDKVDQSATEAAVQGALDQQINPPVVNPPLPWA
jgi:hypothetical protein